MKHINHEAKEQPITTIKKKLVKLINLRQQPVFGDSSCCTILSSEFKAYSGHFTKPIITFIQLVHYVYNDASYLSFIWWWKEWLNFFSSGLLIKTKYMKQHLLYYCLLYSIITSSCQSLIILPGQKSFSVTAPSSTVSCLLSVRPLLRAQS